MTALDVLKAHRLIRHSAEDAPECSCGPWEPETATRDLEEHDEHVAAMLAEGECDPAAAFDITVSGCDDQTKVAVDLSTSELAFLLVIAEKITAASEYGCMPAMTVRPHVHDEDCAEVHQ